MTAPTVDPVAVAQVLAEVAGQTQAHLTGARQAKAAARVELNRRRAAGLAARHRAKLARSTTEMPIAGTKESTP